MKANQINKDFKIKKNIFKIKLVTSFFFLNIDKQNLVENKWEINFTFFLSSVFLRIIKKKKRDKNFI